jgi:hypothetical protein
VGRVTVNTHIFLFGLTLNFRIKILIGYFFSSKILIGFGQVTIFYAKQKNMCVYGHPTHPIFQPPTLTFLISNYLTLIFASDPINF